LYKAHGDAILQYLHPSAQEDALDTIWDPDTNCPISWEEQQGGADDTVPEWARAVQMIQYRNGYRRLSKKMEVRQA
jgi:hypothetical protein